MKLLLQMVWLCLSDLFAVEFVSYFGKNDFTHVFKLVIVRSLSFHRCSNSRLAWRKPLQSRSSKLRTTHLPFIVDILLGIGMSWVFWTHTDLTDLLALETRRLPHILQYISKLLWSIQISLWYVGWLVAFKDRLWRILIISFSVLLLVLFMNELNQMLVKLILKINNKLLRDALIKLLWSWFVLVHW